MKTLFIGHSHLEAIKQAYQIDAMGMEADFIQMLYNPHYLEALTAALSASRYDLVVLSVMGNNHNVYSLVNHPKPFDFVPRGASTATGPHSVVSADVIENDFRIAMAEQFAYMDKIGWYVNVPVVILLPPPPLTENAILLNAGAFKQEISKNGVARSAFRVGCWQVQCQLLRDWASKNDAAVAEPPTSTIDQMGLLKPDYSANDATHGNQKYGAAVILNLIEAFRNITKKTRQRSKLNPYRTLPQSSWRANVVSRPLAELDPVTNPKFKIDLADEIMTAGSCFAQHISKKLISQGFNFLVTESYQDENSSNGLSASNYGVFSARYGNIYTTRQLVQF